MFIELLSGTDHFELVNLDNVAYIYPFGSGTMVVFANPIESKGTRKRLYTTSYNETKSRMEGK